MREEAQKMFLKGYVIATNYSFTLLAYNCAVELMKGASIARQPKIFKKYSQLKRTLFAALEAESLAVEYYFMITMQVNRKRGVTEDVFSEVIAELDTFPCTTIRFLEHYHMIRVLRYLNTMNYSAIKQETKNALEILYKKKGVANSALQFFYKDKAIAHIALKEYAKARELLKKAEQYAPVYSRNRGILYYYQAVNELHSGNYAVAYELYKKYRKSKYDTLSEQWAILGAYLYFLSASKKLDVGTDRFSIGKYLNETSETAHDKTGNKINIIIGELMFYFFNDRDKFIDRAEAASKYPHLNGKGTKRAKAFIKILCAAPKANFNAVALKRIARRQFDNLDRNPLHMGNNISIEIILFGAAGEMVLEVLQGEHRGGQQTQCLPKMSESGLA